MTSSDYNDLIKYVNDSVNTQTDYIKDVTEGVNKSLIAQSVYLNQSVTQITDSQKALNDATNKTITDSIGKLTNDINSIQNNVNQALQYDDQSINSLANAINENQSYVQQLAQNQASLAQSIYDTSGIIAGVSQSVQAINDGLESAKTTTIIQPKANVSSGTVGKVSTAPKTSTASTAPKTSTATKTATSTKSSTAPKTSTSTKSSSGSSGAVITNYKGSSVVDGLKSAGVNSSFDNRAKLAVKEGVVKKESDYKGTASQNSKLLNNLKK
jgi:hypothetical protein